MYNDALKGCGASRGPCQGREKRGKRTQEKKTQKDMYVKKGMRLKDKEEEEEEEEEARVKARDENQLVGERGVKR